MIYLGEANYMNNKDVVEEPDPLGSLPVHSKLLKGAGTERQTET
jgi:hypothetical protein